MVGTSTQPWDADSLNNSFLIESNNNYGGFIGTYQGRSQTSGGNSGGLQIIEDINNRWQIAKKTSGGVIGGSATQVANNLIIEYLGESQVAIDVLTVEPGGNVGVDTTTPYLALTVAAETQKDLGVFNGAVCADNGGMTKCYASLSAGVVYGDSSSFTASDVAENYSINDSSIEAGDIVVLTSSVPTAQKAEEEAQNENPIKELLKATITKASSPYQNKMLGVVSTNAGVLLGDTTGLTLNTETRPVALTGRVPVKVSLENGPIQVGDYITSSSLRGVGMKATRNGPTVGIALESFDENSFRDERGVGKILVFINLSNYSVLAEANSTSTPLTVIDNPDIDIQTLTVRQAATFYGAFYVYGEAGFMHKVVFEKDIEVKGKIYASADQAGTATILANVTSTEVVFTSEYETVPKVIANLSDDSEDTFINWKIAKKTVQGFRIVLQTPIDRDLTFDWIA
jgi:hypothetical protein